MLSRLDLQFIGVPSQEMFYPISGSIFGSVLVPFDFHCILPVKWKSKGTKTVWLPI